MHSEEASLIYAPYPSVFAGYLVGRALVPVVILVIVRADLRYGCIGG